MDELYIWMAEFTEKTIEHNETLLDVINHEFSSEKIRDLSQLDEKVA